MSLMNCVFPGVCWLLVSKIVPLNFIISVMRPVSGMVHVVLYGLWTQMERSTFPCWPPKGVLHHWSLWPYHAWSWRQQLLPSSLIRCWLMNWEFPWHNRSFGQTARLFWLILPTRLGDSKSLWPTGFKRYACIVHQASGAVSKDVWTQLMWSPEDVTWKICLLPGLRVPSSCGAINPNGPVLFLLELTCWKVILKFLLLTSVVFHQWWSSVWMKRLIRWLHSFGIIRAFTSWRKQFRGSEDLYSSCKTNVWSGDLSRVRKWGLLNRSLYVMFRGRFSRWGSHASSKKSSEEIQYFV